MRLPSTETSLDVPFLDTSRRSVVGLSLTPGVDLSGTCRPRMAISGTTSTFNVQGVTSGVSSGVGSV